MAMKIQVLGAALAGVLSMGVVGDVLAGPGDLAAIIIAAGTNPGENAVISDGPNGFQLVEFFLNGVSVSGPFESGTPNVGSAVSGSVNASYGAVADSGIEAFLTFPGFGAPVGRAQEELLAYQIELEESERNESIDLSIDLTTSVETRLLNSIPSGSYFAKPKPSSIETEVNKAINSLQPYTASITPAAGGVAGKFAVANPKAKRPWAIFLNSGLTGLDDDRTGADRRARIWNTSLGAKIRWDPKTTFGFTGGYRSGKVTSNANASKLTGDYFSATFSGDRLLMKALSFGFAATYARGNNTLEIGGGTGDFNVDMFNASASLSGAFKRGEYVIAPSLSAGISQVQRDDR